MMTVYPTEHGMTTAALIAQISHIGDHAADVCRAIEGPNEWNNSRAGGTPMTAAPRERYRRPSTGPCAPTVALTTSRCSGPPRTPSCWQDATAPTTRT